MICHEPPATGVELRGEGGRTVVVVRGEIDLRTASLLRRGMLDAIHRTTDVLVVDLGQTTFLGCCGLEALAASRDELRARGRLLRVRGARGIVHRTLMISDLTDLLWEPADTHLVGVSARP